MAFSYAKLMTITAFPSSGLLAPSAAAALYTNTAAVSTYVAEIEIHNTNSSTVNTILYFVPDNSGTLGTPALSCEISRLTVVAYDTIWIEPKYPYVMTNANESIYGIASNSGVNVMVRGGKDM